MTLRDQLAAARRELALRRSAYPKWIASGRMAKDKAEHEIAAMQAIVETLQKCLDLDEAGIAWVTQGKGEGTNATGSATTGGRP